MFDHEDPNRIATNESWSHKQHNFFTLKLHSIFLRVFI